MSAHHNAEAYLDAYLGGLESAMRKTGPCFAVLIDFEISHLKPMSRIDVFRMIKRRAADASLPSSTCCHTFRATGITAYLENGGTIENAHLTRTSDKVVLPL